VAELAPGTPVEVEYDGRWHAARLLGWSEESGERRAQVAIHGRTGTFLDTVPEERVRAAEG
jgi:hypothetical protein